MKTDIQFKVLGATNYDFEGNKGGKVWIGEETDKDDPNATGLSITSMNAPYEIVDKIRGIHLPADVTLICKTAKGSNNSTRLEVQGVAHSPQKKAA